MLPKTVLIFLHFSSDMLPILFSIVGEMWSKYKHHLNNMSLKKRYWQSKVHLVTIYIIVFAYSTTSCPNTFILLTQLNKWRLPLWKMVFYFQCGFWVKSSRLSVHVWCVIVCKMLKNNLILHELKKFVQFVRDYPL